MKTSSEEPGAELGLQLAATLHEPLLVFVQTIVAARAGKINADPSIHSASVVTRTSERRAESDEDPKQLEFGKAILLEEWIVFFTMISCSDLTQWFITLHPNNANNLETQRPTLPVSNISIM